MSIRSSTLRDHLQENAREQTMSKDYPVVTSEGTWLDSSTFQDGEGTWLTRLGVHRKHKLPLTSLDNYLDNRCRFLNGHTIRHKEVLPPKPRNQPRVVVLWEEDIKTIADHRQPRQPDPTVKDEEGDHWIPDSYLLKKYQVSRSFPRYWRKKRSRLRPGPALRHKEVFNEVRQKGSPSTHHLNLEEDVQCILNGDESARRGVGRGEAADHFREELHRKAREFLKAILADGPMPSLEVIRRAEQAGTKRTVLYQAKKALKLKALKLSKGRCPWHWHLPGQQPLGDGRGKDGQAAVASSATIPYVASALASEEQPHTQPMPAGADPVLEEAAAPRAVPEGQCNQLGLWPEEPDEVSGHAKTKRRLGRRPSEETEEVLQFCYDQYANTSLKLAQIREKARMRFGNRAPKSDGNVSEYASRYAERYHLPLERPSTQKNP
jgi:hypothetical protein